MFNNIPEELRALSQWICWRYEDIGAKKPTKVPYNPKTGYHADVNNPATWATFNEAISVKMVSGAFDPATNPLDTGFSGIGFVFSINDPYAFIDLDDTSGDQVSYDRQIKIFHEFDSYAEISPSGKGLHIVIKGGIPAGRKRSSIEIYSSQRYATFTGNVYNNKPIAERQSMLTQLWEQMGSGVATHIYQGDDKELFNDKEIIEKATAAINGDKFNTLLSGKWEELYQSQSEADFAFIDIVAFYTQNKNQIARIFRNSLLGQRKKAQRNDYLSWMINKSFDRMLPPIDFDGFRNALETKLAANKQLELKLGASPSGKASVFDTDTVGSNPTAPASSILIPPGLLGELAQFIYQSAPRPVPEIALAGAIGLMAGICGRAYNISGTGLNQYVLLIAPTGSGKEAMALGIDKLIGAIRLQVPTSPAFVGPSEIASGQALIKHLNKTSSCFVSILGEFGLRLQSMSNPRGSTSEVALRRMFLDLYNKSGHGQVFRGSIYSDRDKNIEATTSPSFTVLAESTPETFYGALNEEMISEGLLPRFMLVEYTGKRPVINENHVNVTPSFILIERFASLVANVEMIMHAKRVINVRSNDEATALLRSFDKFADDKINETSKDTLKQLWNRAHMKAMKISALIAVGVNMSDPLILPEFVSWAINMVQSDIRALSDKFETGQIGSHSFENKQLDEMNRIIKEYVSAPWDKISKYTDARNLFENKIVPYAYLSRRLICVSVFRLDRLGATNALKRTIQMLVDSDKLRELGRGDLTIKFGTTQKAYVISNMGMLN